MKYAHTFNTRYAADYPAFWGTSWLNDMLAHLDLNRMSPEDKAVLEMKMLTMKMLSDAYKKDVAAAEKVAAEKAEHTALVAVAKNCLEEGFDIAITSKIAKLSIEEVTEIKQHIDNEKI